MTTTRAYLGLVVLYVSALAAALGLRSAVWHVAVANSRAFTGRLPFLLCLAVAAVAVMLSRRPNVRNGVLATTVRISFLFAIIPILLLSLASAPFESTKEAYNVAMMRFDLRALDSVEARVFSDSGHYTSDVGMDFNRRAGVTIALLHVSESGWSATATTSGTTRRCAIFVGSRPEPPAQRPGEAACTTVPLSQTLRGAAPGLAALILGLALATAGATAWVSRLAAP